VYLSAQQLTLANQAVLETFENTSIAWQAIPHWNVGDPGQSRVRNDVVDNPGFLNLELLQIPFQLTLVQTNAPSTDSVVCEVTGHATELAHQFDLYVLYWLGVFAWITNKIDFNETSQDVLLQNLIDARAIIEDAGYRAPSCLITSTQGLKSLSSLTAGYPIVESLLDAAHVNSLHRTSLYEFVVDAVDDKGAPTTDPKTGLPVPKPRTVMVMLGRRQLIAHGAAMDASPGEEPVDVAVSVLPSVEVVGEGPSSLLELSVRIRFALRIKDPKSLVLLWGTPVYMPSP
jgi:hypothetical protein